MCYRLCELWQSFRKRCQDTEEKFHAKDPFESSTGEVFVKQEPPESDNWEEQQDEPSDERMDDSTIPETRKNSSADNLMLSNDFPGGSSMANQQNWEFSMKFISLRQAKRYLKESGLYCVDFDVDLPLTTYRCKKVSATTQVQCRAQVELHVVKKSGKEEVHLYKSSEPHEHSSVPVPKGNAPTHSQLKALVFMGKTRDQIKEHLQQKGFTCPSDASLDDHIKLHQMRMANLYKAPPRTPLSKRMQCSKAVLKSD